MTGKARVLFLLRYLRDHTDEGKDVTAGEILKAFQAEGDNISRPTLREDIASLQEAGFEIDIREVPGKGTYYKLMDREFTLPELQILVDAVASGMFISPKRSGELVEKLQSMAGPTEREQLVPGIRVSNQVKAKNDQIIQIISTIKYAIMQDMQIRFKYREYGPDLKQVPKHGEKYEYQVSPYAMIWKKDRYYLVGWSENHGKTVHFRIDRIEAPKLLKLERQPVPADLRLEDRSDKIFDMFDGPEETVTLRLRPKLIGQVIDHFGEDLQVSNVKKNQMDVTVQVHLSPTFYGWLFQYVGEMTVTAPEYVCQVYAEKMQQGIDDVLGN